VLFCLSADELKGVKIFDDEIDLFRGQDLMLAKWRHDRIRIRNPRIPDLPSQLLPIGETRWDISQGRADIGRRHCTGVGRHGMTGKAIAFPHVLCQSRPCSYARWHVREAGASEHEAYGANE
jgi:hypothetical protein